MSRKEDMLTDSVTNTKSHSANTIEEKFYIPKTKIFPPFWRERVKKMDDLAFQHLWLAVCMLFDSEPNQLVVLKY